MSPKEITAVLVRTGPDRSEWVDVVPGSVEPLDRWGTKVRFEEAKTGEVWTIPGRDGTLAGTRRLRQAR